MDGALALKLVFIPFVREALAAWGPQTQASALWNARPGWEQPESIILDSIPLPLLAKPERPALLGDLTRSLVPERKAGQEQGHRRTD